jgi:hypothetical protein
LYATHPQHEILTSRIFVIAAGYEDAKDYDTRRHDPAFQVAAGRTPTQSDYSNESENSPLESPSTHSLFENRIDANMISKLHKVLVDTFLSSFDTPPEEIILDYDATDDPIHGNQERRHFNGSRITTAIFRCMFFGRSNTGLLSTAQQRRCGSPLACRNQTLIE